MSKRFTYYGGIQTALLLDLYPSTTAYSVRKLRTSYNGACMRVRRSNDNAEQDIGFVGNDLDTASLLSFVGANNGFVTIWYDQMNTANASQTSASNQPLIVDNGNLIQQNGKPAVYTPGGKNLNTGLFALPSFGDITLDFFAVLNNQSASQDSHLLGLSNRNRTNNRSRVLFFGNDSSSTKSVRLYGGNIVYSSSDSGQLLFNTNYQGGGGAFQSRINGNILSVNSFINSGLNINQSSGFMLMSGLTSANPQIYVANPNSVGYVQEFIPYLSDQSANRTAIETKINNYYAIYP